MLCEKCNKETDGDNARFCAYCGHNFKEGDRRIKVKLIIDTEMTADEIKKFIK